MGGNPINLCSKSLLLFLQSLNKGSYFHLIGFGSNFEYYSPQPLEYNKENVKKLFGIIKNLKADKGGTDLYRPLSHIFKNPVYDNINIGKHIFLLTDGEIENKENTLNLIGNYSSKFVLHSLGIGGCDLDLIKRSAIMGNGNSFFINNLENLNNTVINALEGADNLMSCYFKINKQEKIYLQYNKTQLVPANGFIRFGFILKDKDINDIEILFKLYIKESKEEKKIILNKSNMKSLPDGDKLGKIIVCIIFKYAIQLMKKRK